MTELIVRGIPTAITILIVSIVVPAIITWMAAKSDAAAVVNEVRVSKVVLYIGLICTAIFLLIMVAGIVTADDVYERASVVILSFPLVAIGLLLVLAYNNCFISYDDEGFVQRNIFRIRHRYKYSQVTGIINDKYNTKLIVNCKKKVRLERFSTGRKEFSKTINKWRRVNNVHPSSIPEAKETLFNDNVLDAEGFVAVWLLTLTVSGSMVLGTIVLLLRELSFQGKLTPVVILVGFWLLGFLVGPIFNYFVSNAERYPRITKALVRPGYIKNPVVRSKLRLRPIQDKKKKRK